MNKTRAQSKRISKTQTVVNWASRNRPGLIRASVLLLPALLVFALISMDRGRSIVILALLLAVVGLACGVLTIAVAQIIELLKAIRRELVMIRTRIDTELLDDIATDVTAMRTQMGKGVFGLLGT